MSSKKAEARERVKAMREAQARQERKRERVVRFGVAGAVVAAIVIIAVAIAASRGGDDGPAALPATVSETGGGISVGQDDAPVTIDSWIDFLCPHCQEFEAANGAAIDELVEAGQARVVYHPLTFTGGAYSTRANNAFGCAADEDMATEFLQAAFANAQQWTSEALIDLGDSAGIGGEYEACVNDGTYEDWSTDATRSGRDAQIEGTPTLFVNGEQLPSTYWTPDGIREAVETVAAGDSLAPTPAATPPGGAATQ